jgi:hypothetical protein
MERIWNTEQLTIEDLKDWPYMCKLPKPYSHKRRSIKVEPDT